MKKYETSNAVETVELGKKIGALLKTGDVCLLVGDLSAGKTTITKGIGAALGIKRVINSPTFCIVKSYQGTDTVLYHLDLYRLEGLNQDFDLEEYIGTDGICVIEWPHQIDEILPKEYLEIDLRRTGEDTRSITITGIGDRYTDIERKL